MNKEEKKSRFCRACLLLCLCLLSASCVSGEGEYEQEIPMEVALTRTDGVAGSESTPLLLFWKETDFSTGTLGSPYKTSTPAGGSVITSMHPIIRKRIIRLITPGWW